MGDQQQPKDEQQDKNYGSRGGVKDEQPAGDGGRVGATDVTPGAGGYGGDRSGAPGGAPPKTGGEA